MSADRMAGLAAVLGGAGLLAEAARHAPLPHLPLGPGLAPALVGLGLLAVGSVLLWTGRTTVAPDGAARTGTDCPRAAPRIARALLTLALPAAGAAVLARLGLPLVLLLVLAPLLALSTGRPAAALALALAASAALTALFHGLLGVPLPPGPLAGRLPWS